ncbi:MAG: hypothetical protein PHN63_00540, partial [Candidatus Omnitrophica bacterium]|nr:hypothetical protein [Candidatus Omnitrophota bacterium]
LTVVFGLAAPLILKYLVRVSGSVLSVDTSAAGFTLHNLIIAPRGSGGIYLSPSLLALGLIVIIGMTVLAVYAVWGRRRLTTGKTWDCGYYPAICLDQGGIPPVSDRGRDKLDPRTEYTATAFSKPFRIAFDFFLLPYRKTEKIRESFYHVKSFKYELYTTPVFKEYIYQPLLRAVFKISDSLKRAQSGSIHLYIAYIFITMLALIIFMSRF